MTLAAAADSTQAPGAGVAFLRSLIAAQAKGEAAVQAVIAERLRAAGCRVEAVDYIPAEVPIKGELVAPATQSRGPRTAIVGTLDGDPDRPSLLIFAHPDGEPLAGTDTWQRDPFGGVVDGGRLYGWGVADDLAGCAAAVLAIEQVAAAKAPMGRAVFASTPSKHYARGVAALLHRGLTADAALYLHPAESGQGMGEIKAVASGQLEFRITVTGAPPDTTEPGHTAFSHLGANPVDKAVTLHAALMALAEARARRLRHPRIEAAVGRATNLHISRLACGEMAKFSRIETACEIGGAVSFPPGEPMDAVMAEVEAAIAAAAQADPWMAAHPPRIAWVTGVTGAEVSADHPLYRAAAAAVTEVTGAAPQVNPMHTSSDIRNPMVEAGIPCIGLGCLGGDLSQNGRQNEWVDVADFQRMVTVTARTVTAWCAGPAAASPGPKGRERPQLSPTERT